MMDAALQEFLRRAAFAGAGPSMGSTFAPAPITFAPPQIGQSPSFATTEQQNVVPVIPGFGAASYYTGSDSGVGQAFSAPMSFEPIDNPISSINDFEGVPMTKADLVGFGTNIFTPSLFNLVSLALTGQTIGQQVKAALTPVSTAQPISIEAFNLGEQIGIPAVEAQGLIDAMGGTSAIGGQDLGAVAAQSLGFDIGTPGTATGMGDVGGFGVGDASAGVTGPGMGVE
jgi:hypothetical protein